MTDLDPLRARVALLACAALYEGASWEEVAGAVENAVDDVPDDPAEIDAWFPYQADEFHPDMGRAIDEVRKGARREDVDLTDEVPGGVE